MIRKLIKTKSEGLRVTYYGGLFHILQLIELSTNPSEEE